MDNTTHIRSSSTAAETTRTNTQNLRVLQITDTHLYADATRCLLGINTLETLDQILSLAQRSSPPADMIIATGDLVHDASVDGYRTLRQRFSSLGIPTYCLPGNHDDPNTLKDEIRNDIVRFVPSVQARGWSLVFLDSTIPGEEGGHLNEAQLSQLEQTLNGNRDQHTLVCLHHHPVPIGSRWMDEMVLDNPEPLFEIIQGHPQVRGVACGHIHQEFCAEHSGVRIYGAPSTCIQFAPGGDGFGVDALPPGYRWFELCPDGEIRTGIERLAEYPSEIDLMSAGY